MALGSSSTFVLTALFSNLLVLDDKGGEKYDLKLLSCPVSVFVESAWCL